MLPEIGEQGQKRLSEARVLSVGAGGLGSPISTYLTGAGVGTIGIMDDDLVSITNLQRQILYSEAQEGSPKVECAKERLSALNSTIRINTYQFRATPETLSGLLPDYDIIVDATDNFNSMEQYMLLKAVWQCFVWDMQRSGPCIRTRSRHCLCLIQDVL